MILTVVVAAQAKGVGDGLGSAREGLRGLVNEGLALVLGVAGAAGERVGGLLGGGLLVG